MSSYVENESTVYEFGDIVEFDLPFSQERSQGEIVRIYNARDDYHVIDVLSGERISINVHADNVKLVRRA